MSGFFINRPVPRMKEYRIPLYVKWSQVC